MLCGGLTRGEVFVIVIPDSIRDPWIAGRARNDKFEGRNEKFEGRNEKFEGRNDKSQAHND